MHWEMKQRERLTNEQAREMIAMDFSCRDHARKDEFHKVVLGLSPSSRILRTIAAVVLTFLDTPGGLLCPWCMKSSKRLRILKVTQSNLVIFLHSFVCASNGCIIVSDTGIYNKQQGIHSLRTSLYIPNVEAIYQLLFHLILERVVTFFVRWR